MIEKVLIINKLKSFFDNIKIEDFIKVFIISFLYDKVNYIEKIIGTQNSIQMMEKYIYNLTNNIVTIKKLEKYHSIYAKYDYKTKTLKYYMTNEYYKVKNLNLSDENKKILIIKEFKLMMYKELERVINISSVNEKIVSNGFYIEDKNGRYPDYGGDFSDIFDIFCDDEVCNILNENNYIKVFLDKEREHYVYAKHISNRNSEVLNYVALWRKFFDEKLYYFAISNPQMYSEKLINNFNTEYSYIFDYQHKFLLNNKDVFSLIENYLLHIRNKINVENNIQYHKEMSLIFEILNYRKNYNIEKNVIQKVNKIDKKSRDIL